MRAVQTARDWVEISLIGETIGSYRVLSQLGAGAMGEVYLAEHRHLKRKAAVKLLARELVGRPDLLERFFLEARATSAIAHPGIVQIFDCEVDATGRPYIVMEHLEGETLSATLARRGPLPPATVARLTRSMAEALEAAHTKGIVHRDLKPDNVFVQAEPPDTAKLVDFGIAKLAGDFRAGQVHQTRSGALMGTPLYMSPEQCRDSAAIDFRTDLYSLGCVLFEMLTGRPPFTHDALGDLVVAHMTEQPKDARAVNPAVPAALAALAADLLQKDPSRRPANMRQVADRMAAFLGGLTTVPETAKAAASDVVGTVPPPKKTTFGDTAAELVDDAVEAGLVPRRRGRMVFGVAVALALAGGGALVATRLGGVAGVQPEVAVAPSAGTTAPVAGAAVAPIAPAASPVAPAVRPGKGEKDDGDDKKASSRGKKSPRRGGLEPAVAGAPSAGAKGTGALAAAAAVEAPTAPPPVAAAAADLTGSWEGPWDDPGKQQKGRLFLQIGGDGAVAGWMSNGAAQQSFRLAGRMTPSGHLDLACQCPKDQGFSARGQLHPNGDGALKGQLALSTGAGIFGQSHLSLKRATAPR